jgi:Zn-dependent protease with chaperone function
MVTVTEAGLSLVASSGGVIAGWPYSAVRYLADEVRGGPVRLASGDARLTVEDRALAAAIFAHAPWLRPHGWRAIAISGVTAAIVLLVGAGLYVGLPIFAGHVAALIPARWEERIGDDVLHELAWKRCAGVEGQAALDSLTQRLIAGTAMPYRLEVTVRDSGIVNAFALPGGRVSILRGLLQAARSPEEVAGVLAHELTHVLKRHPMRNMIASQGVSLFLDLITGGGVGGTVGTVLATLSYTRAAEEEADAGALQLLDRAGIDTEGFASFFERMSKQDEAQGGKSEGLGFTVPNYLRTHPATQQRIAAVRAQPSHGKTPALNPAQWQALKSICGADEK